MSAVYAPLPASAVRYIVVHCSATPPSMDIGAKEIDRMHRDIGWLGIGYHRVIRRNGVVEEGRPLDAVGAHEPQANRCSVSICMVGGVERATDVKRDSRGAVINFISKNNFTDDQFAALALQVQELRSKFPGAEVLGHRDFPGVKKDCPCFDVRQWVKETIDAPELC